MYEMLKISNFRGFKELTVSNFARINLIAGRNNAGKTSLLEALFLHGGVYNPARAFQINMQRRVNVPFSDPTGGIWDTLFNSVELPVVIEGRDKETGHRTIQFEVITDFEDLQQLKNVFPKAISPVNGGLNSETVQVLRETIEQDNYPKRDVLHIVFDREGQIHYELPSSSPRFTVVFVPAGASPSPEEEASRFSKLEISGKQQLLLDALQMIDQRVKRLTLLYVGNEPTIYADIGKLLPLNVLGDGMNRLAHFISTLGLVSNGVMLIDEVENGFHYSVLTDVWRAIYRAAREFDVQVFATTHSLECIRAAHEAFSTEAVYDFALHRLDRLDDGRVEATTYDKDTIAAALDLNIEVR